MDGALFGHLPPLGVSELLPRGLVHSDFPGISSCWTVTWVVSVHLWHPYPFKTFKKHSLFFVAGASASGPTQSSCCPVSLVSRTPRMHGVCALVQMAGAGCSAVLGSLPALTPLLPPGAGVRGARVQPGQGLYPTPFTRRWALTGVDVVWLLSSVFWNVF